MAETGHPIAKDAALTAALNLSIRTAPKGYHHDLAL
jgi:hypothetical protein